MPSELSQRSHSQPIWTSTHCQKKVFAELRASSDQSESECKKIKDKADKDQIKCSLSLLLSLGVNGP